MPRQAQPAACTAGRVRPGGQPVVIVMRSHLVASGDDAADKVRAVEGKIGRRVKRGPQLQPREQVQQELQPLGADRKLGAEIDSAARCSRLIFSWESLLNI